MTTLLVFFPLFCFVLSFLRDKGIKIIYTTQNSPSLWIYSKNNARHYTMKKQVWLNQTLHDRYMYLQIVLVALSGNLLHFPNHTPVSSIWTQAHQCTALASSIWQNPGKTCKFIVTHITALQRLSINTKKNCTLQSRVNKELTERSNHCLEQFKPVNLCVVNYYITTSEWLELLWWRANARNVSFFTLYSG